MRRNLEDQEPMQVGMIRTLDAVNVRSTALFFGIFLFGGWRLVGPGFI